MNILKRIQSSLYEIKNKIKANSEIRKLLYYTENNPLEKEEVSYKTIDNFITLKPVFNMNAETFNRNSFISIGITEMEKKENDIFEGILRINVICKNEIWEINNNQVRPLQIIGILESLLDGSKFDISHKLHFLNMQTIVLDEFNSGFMVLFGIEEAMGLTNEF